MKTFTFEGLPILESEFVAKDKIIRMDAVTFPGVLGIMNTPDRIIVHPDTLIRLIFSMEQIDFDTRLNWACDVVKRRIHNHVDLVADKLIR